jgi:hypothetical protein
MPPKSGENKLKDAAKNRQQALKKAVQNYVGGGSPTAIAHGLAAHDPNAVAIAFIFDKDKNGDAFVSMYTSPQFHGSLVETGIIARSVCP